MNLNIPFLTLPRYGGRTITSSAGGLNSKGDKANDTWLAANDAPDWVSSAALPLFGDKDTLQEVLRLDYADSNKLGNAMYQLRGNKDCYFLKVLGDSPGNRREILVWEILGYMGNPQDFKPIKGLPPRTKILIDQGMGAILTPLYDGSLKAVSGGRYELPLVLSALLYIEETLTHLHQRGLLYMDLCPSNILFKEAPNGALLYFLTDMGGVKPLQGHPQTAHFEELVQAVGNRRWTRREVLPPREKLMDPDAPVEPMREYDYYTLARTAHILLGLGNQENVPSQVLEQFGDLSIETPMQPRHQEVARFCEILRPLLRGTVLNNQAIIEFRTQTQELFRDFFMSRAEFATKHLGQGPIKGAWTQLLLKRATRYQKALGKDFKAFYAQLEEALSSEGQCDFEADQRLLESLPATLRDNAQAGLEGLESLAQSPLVTYSRNANYAFHYHKTLWRTIWLQEGQTYQERLNKLDAHKLPRYQVVFEESEHQTNQEIRHMTTQPQDLTTLNRSIELPI